MMNLILEAASFTSTAHAGQFRKYPDHWGIIQPYIIHPGRVSPHAKILKMLDRIDNLYDMGNAPAGFANTYIEESWDLLDCIGDANNQISNDMTDAIFSVSTYFDSDFQD